MAFSGEPATAETNSSRLNNQLKIGHTIIAFWSIWKICSDKFYIYYDYFSIQVMTVSTHVKHLLHEMKAESTHAV